MLPIPWQIILIAFLFVCLSACHCCCCYCCCRCFAAPSFDFIFYASSTSTRPSFEHVPPTNSKETNCPTTFYEPSSFNSDLVCHDSERYLVSALLINGMSKRAVLIQLLGLYMIAIRNAHWHRKGKRRASKRKNGISLSINMYNVYISIYCKNICCENTWVGAVQR